MSRMLPALLFASRLVPRRWLGLFPCLAGSPSGRSLLCVVFLSVFLASSRFFRSCLRGLAFVAFVGGSGFSLALRVSPPWGVSPFRFRAPLPVLPRGCSFPPVARAFPLPCGWPLGGRPPCFFALSRSVFVRLVCGPSLPLGLCRSSSFSPLLPPSPSPCAPLALALSP